MNKSQKLSNWKSRAFTYLFLVLLLCIQPSGTRGQETDNKGDYYSEMHQAARDGDTGKVRELLKAGVDVNLKNRYRLTALYYSADRGDAETVKVLLEAGAETEIPNEPYYRLSPMIMAARKGHAEVVRLLLEHDAQCGSWTASWPASLGHTETVKVLVNLRPKTYRGDVLDQLAGTALSNGNEKLLKFLKEKGAEPKLPADSKVEIAALTNGEQTNIDGQYKIKSGEELTRVWARRGSLFLGNELGLAVELQRISDTEFVARESSEFRVSLPRPFGKRLLISQTKMDAAEEKDDVREFVKINSSAIGGVKVNKRISSGRWTRFRGENGDGIADNMDLPTKFDATVNRNMLWKTKIPGVGHSSPVIWGDKVFVTTAEAISADPKYRLSVASGFDTHKEEIEYRWLVLCVDLNTGELIWKRQLDQGIPKARRHVMSSHANCTPVVDAQRLIVNLAGQGVYCLNHAGDVLWKKDLGKLAAGWFMDPGYEWGFASSPVMQDGVVYLQCDVFDGAFITALSSENGEQIWRTKRDEISSWGTPLLVETEGEVKLQLVTNGTRAICGYDASNGQELWRIEENSEVTVASPVKNGEHVIVTGGYQPVKPIFSIDVTRRGNLTPDKDSTDAKSNGLQWWASKGGAYSVTPIVYRGLLYITQSNGVMATYRADTGEQVYKKRVVSGRSGDIVASPIASDGKIYLVGGDGDVFVIPAGEEYQKPMVCPVGEQVMATPAAAKERLIVRGVEHLFCFTQDRTK